MAVGKYYNKYMDERDSEAQYSDVKIVLSLNNHIFLFQFFLGW